jgi:hypothetical protein
MEMTDPTSGFIAPHGNGTPTILGPLTPRPWQRTLAKAARILGQELTAEGFTGEVVTVYRAGIVVDVEVRRAASTDSASALA